MGKTPLQRLVKFVALSVSISLLFQHSHAAEDMIAEFSPTIGHFSQWKHEIEGQVKTVKSYSKSNTNVANSIASVQIRYVSVEACVNSLLDRVIFDIQN